MAIITLRNGIEAIVDDDDIEFLQHFHWRQFPKTGHVYYSSRTKPVYLHRMIMEPCDPFFIDHINRDPLDNRKANLRLVLPIENSWNRSQPYKQSSKYYGVTLTKHGTWNACMSTRTGKKYLGRYNTELEAAVAYDIASKKHWGDVARLNFPDGSPLITPRRRPGVDRFARKFRLTASHAETGGAIADIRIKGEDMHEREALLELIQDALGSFDLPKSTFS